MKISFGDKMPGFQLGSAETKNLKLYSKQNGDFVFLKEGWGEHGDVETIYGRDCSSH